ncbi:hypothetical protein PT2222_70111 [Paraburkholderia tropica]
MRDFLREELLPIYLAVNSANIGEK